MRKIALTLLFALACMGTYAQEEKSILEIDQSSFAPVQTDALSGVAIDKIPLDRSKRPCARIKLHINRMTREQIDGLIVHIKGGMVELTKKVTAVEGNGLIIEMTAKEQTRFYLHHDKFGDSNEVTVDLEGNKEYRMEAQLNLLLPVVVATNVKGADVYLDDVFVGTTNEQYMCPIADVVPGMHKIRVVHGAATVEREFDVSSESYSFRMEVSTKSQAQYVLFEVEPRNAVVMIDNTPHIAKDGFVQITLNNGTHQWHVMAEGYHAQSGTFIVSGEKVDKKVALLPDAAQVTITSGPGVEIWINGEKKGLSPWRGMLNSGIYRFEARKENCRTVTMSHTITSEVAEQSYTIDTPTPIMGSLQISSTPPRADIFIDGKVVGQTPMMLDLTVGQHRLALNRAGYEYWTEEITIEESKSLERMVEMTRLLASSPQLPTATPQEPQSQPEEKVKPAKEPKQKPEKEPKTKPVKEPKPQPVKTPKQVKPVEKGFEQSISLGTDIGLGSYKLVDFGINYIAGYRVSNGFFVGAGTGVNIVVKDDGSGLDGSANMYERYCPAASKVMIPLYLHLRAYLSKSKYQPYFGLSGGAKIGLKGKPELVIVNHKEETIHSEPYSSTNLFIEPAFGLNIRTKKDRASIFMQFGGLMQMRPYYRPVSDTQGALSRRMSGGLTIKLGCTF